MASGTTLAKLEGPNRDRATSLRFTPDGARLVSVAQYSRALHVWDLRAIRTELAAVGLDWKQKPFSPASVPAKSEPLVVHVTGIGQAPAPPALVWTPPPRRRTATPKEVAQWIDQLDHKDAKVRQDAETALRAVGRAALPALDKAARFGTASLKKSAAAVSDRIYLQEALEPRHVSLNLKETPGAEALQALAKQGRINLECTSTKSITLELTDVPFWKALDRVCVEAGLTWIVAVKNPLTLQLVERAPWPQETIAYAGPLRLQVNSLTYRRSLGFTTAEAMRLEDCSLAINRSMTPGHPIIGVAMPRISQATDAKGAVIFRKREAPAVLPYSNVVEGSFTLPLVTFQATLPRDGRLKELRGILPVEVLAERRALASVVNPLQAANKTVHHNGIRLTIHSAKSQFNATIVRLSLTGPWHWNYNPSLHGLEMFDARKRGYRVLSPQLTAQPRRQASPQDMTWFLGGPGAGGTAAIPWSALAGAAPGRWEWTGTIFFQTPGETFAPFGMTLFSCRRIRTDLPFEFHDLRVP
jgi:hypothetical protein